MVSDITIKYVTSLLVGANQTSIAPASAVTKVLCKKSDTITISI